LGRTLTLETEPGKTKRIETQILHYDGAFWQAYTFAWRDDQSEADLVPADGSEKYLTIADARIPGGKREQTWSFASRTQCLTCHTPWAEVSLAFNLTQLNKKVNDVNQLVSLCEMGMIQRLDKDKKPKEAFTAKNIKNLDNLTNPYDAKENLNDRARSYLHVNCSHCHRNGGGGSVPFELTTGSDLKAVLDVKPTRGEFTLPGARIIKRGHPEQSTLVYRMAKFGKDRMPHIGAELPDLRGVALISEWIIDRDQPTNAATKTVPMEEQILKPETALKLAQQCGDADLSATKAVVEKAMKLPAGPARDLFEGYFPPTGGERKLGPNPRPKAITSLTGNAENGKAIFLLAANKCIDCHQHSGQGKEIGPELTTIAKTRSKDELLESLLLPSRRVEAKYQSYILRCEDGQCHTGVIVKRDATMTILRDATGKDHQYKTADIESLTPARESIMPSGLLADMTPQQAADLLEFLMKSGK
jgi:putative heme-binding domain-containing protein